VEKPAVNVLGCSHSVDRIGWTTEFIECMWSCWSTCVCQCQLYWNFDV